ncbi:MAG: serine/threonine-protein phosphatase [Anaerolineales bacterium]|nr:serine/threonine-protein phosphatase [Anaerolineales bacterium]
MPEPRPEVAADSNVGRVRTNNEDRYAVIPLDCKDAPGVLALVADGVGGHAAGEVASQMVVDEIAREAQADPCANPAKVLPQLVVRAGRAVFDRARQDPELQGMATTLAGAWLVGRRLYTVTVGDSRIYMRRGGRTFQASIDHTWVQDAVEHKLLTPAQARIHPNAHVLRRHLGGKEDPEPDQRLRLEEDDEAPGSVEHQGMTLEDGDALVLCSDGLSDLVKEEEIGRALRHRKLERTVGELIELARSRGGHDNITIVALRIPAKREKAARPGALAVLAVSAVILAAIAAAVYFLIISPVR